MTARAIEYAATRGRGWGRTPTELVGPACKKLLGLMDGAEFDMGQV